MAAQRAAPPLHVGDVTLVLVERAEILSGSGDAGCWMSAFKEPVALVVCDSSGVRALSPNASEIALDHLVEETPSLDAILAGLNTR